MLEKGAIGSFLPNYFNHSRDICIKSNIRIVMKQIVQYIYEQETQTSDTYCYVYDTAIDFLGHEQFSGSLSQYS